MGMHIHWAVIDSTDADDFHQFFYFDAEEYGFETYKSLWVNDRKSVEAIEHSMIDCLGGRKIPVAEREACCIRTTLLLLTIGQAARYNSSSQKQ